VHHGIYDRLVQVARSGDLVTYGEIAPLAGLDMADPGDRSRIAHILGEISTEEHQLGRPLLSAVVVLQDQNKPGEGFFHLARELGVYQGKSDDDYFVQEVKRVHQYWKKQ
jgi:hypothetical protein